MENKKETLTSQVDKYYWFCYVNNLVPCRAASLAAFFRRENRIKLYYLGNRDSFDYGNIVGIYYGELDYEYFIARDKFENSLKEVVCARNCRRCDDKVWDLALEIAQYDYEYLAELFIEELCKYWWDYAVLAASEEDEDAEQDKAQGADTDDCDFVSADFKW